MKEGNLIVQGTLQADGGIIPVAADSIEARPTCDSSNRGMMFSVNGGAGEKDRKFVCYQDGGNYYWEQTAPDWREEAATTIKEGLVGHWTFNEGQGTTAYDYSGNNNDGTLNHSQCPTSVVKAFTNVGTTSWTVPDGVTEVSVLVVAGGGSGGNGGGGAGGVIFEDGYSVTPAGSISITVGGGGDAIPEGTSSSGNDGGNSFFDTLESIGGGGGGKYSSNGRTGGSGGGSGYTGESGTPFIGGTGTENQGHNGGSGTAGSPWNSGGGGGAGEEGSDGGTIGDGGKGMYFGNIFGEQYGENGWFAGGGGGGGGDGASGSGGIGGGGAGGYGTSDNKTGEDAIENTGGGGGGTSSNSSANYGSGAGGSGVVLIRYEYTPEYNPCNIVAFETVGSHTWTVPEGVEEVDVLVVGGGGGGGGGRRYQGGGGGGGAGGVLFESSFDVSSVENINLIVGAGGAGGIGYSTPEGGENGENSSFGTVEAFGGGGGGSYFVDGKNGGSGGGGAASTTFSGLAGFPTDSFQGNKGGDGSFKGEYKGGGGGGAGKSGEGEGGFVPGNGGKGMYFGNIFGEEYGENGWFSGGGGGGSYTANDVIGGRGGGGDGSIYDGENGEENTGGGGGGGGINSNSELIYQGGTGGSGIVLIRYYKNPHQQTTQGQALEFDGVSDYVDAGNDASLNITDEITISAWIKTFGTVTESGIYAQGSNFAGISAPGYSLRIRLGVPAFAVRKGDNSHYWDLFNGTNIADGQWHHIVGTFDTDNIKRYLDGELEQESLTGQSALGTIGSKIGVLNNKYFNGQIDDVRIYNRALRPEEIRYLYETTYRD
jgi:hypothetical protein